MPSKLLPRAARHPEVSVESAMESQARAARWRALRREDVLEPDLPIIDPHHHLWERAGARYLLDEHLADVRTGHDIRATVFVECGSFYRANAPAAMAPLGEVEFANGVGAMTASGSYGKTLVCAGIVGTADLSTGVEAARLLDAHLAAAGERFRGIRMIVKWDADEALNNGRYVIPRGLMRDPDFRAGFALLAPRGLSFDAMVYHPQIPELADLARAFPDTTIVLNHIGGLLARTRAYRDRMEEATAHWRAALTDLAKCPNVFVKLGGLGMPYLGFGLERLETPAPSERLAQVWGPLFDDCIAAFGPSRCMFESNFPPDRDSVDYPVLWNAFKRVAARYSAAERQALFFDTAARAYRLDVQP
jgi:predicted TIM-barrel fold metal-dependent hydrolase